ncbi:MAG: tetratricopeptide repeat protein, partial [Verrucomicrobia bacterium]|nr:tetratricopeptide repeat protein [Verrucomicrobiota bacterium]
MQSDTQGSATLHPGLKSYAPTALNTYGPKDPETAEAINELAVLFQKNGEYTKAEPLYRQALAIQQKVLGAEHLDTAATLNALGSLYTTVHEYA